MALQFVLWIKCHYGDQIKGDGVVADGREGKYEYMHIFVTT